VAIEARRLPLLLLLRLLLLLLVVVLLLVPLGVITPRGWWWRRDRRTDAPLRAVGLEAGLLGPTCSPLALLGGSETSGPSARCRPRRLSSFDPFGATWGRGTACNPFALVQGAGGHGGIGAASHTGRLGPLAGASEIQILRWGSRPPV
jgi:hypothetical protein